MKMAFTKPGYPWFVICCLAGMLVIVACNVWLLCCGHCVLYDYLNIPVMGWTVIAANLVAGLVLVAVRRRRKAIPGTLCCRHCQAGMRQAWKYCPNCGSEHGL